MKLLKQITNLFRKSGYQTGLEQYLKSKNPSNVAEVEYWSRQYDQASRRQWMI